MKVVVVFEFAGITDSNSPEADLIIEEIGQDCEAWRLDTGATFVHIEESFDSEQENQEIDLDGGVSAVNEDGVLEPYATFDEQHGGSDDPRDEAMFDDDDDDMNDNHKKASAIYEAKGQFAVHVAAIDGTLKVDRWAHCVPCEIESPIEDDACLVCGTLSRKK